MRNRHIMHGHYAGGMALTVSQGSSPFPTPEYLESCTSLSLSLLLSFPCPYHLSKPVKLPTAAKTNTHHGWTTQTLRLRSLHFRCRPS